MSWLQSIFPHIIDGHGFLMREYIGKANLDSISRRLC